MYSVVLTVADMCSLTFQLCRDGVDMLPVIPVFSVASAIGVPLVDKTVGVKTIADAIVAGLEGEDIHGVQRFGEMERIYEGVR